MGRHPKLDGVMKKGAWSLEEDERLKNFINIHGLKRHNWETISKKAGLKRSGKSCRLRWKNYLNPHIKRGNFSYEEELIIIDHRSRLGNKWSEIAAKLPGRTDNEIKNYWNTKLRKKLFHKAGNNINVESSSTLQDQPHQINTIPDYNVNNLANYSNMANLITNVSVLLAFLMPQIDVAQIGLLLEGLVRKLQEMIINIPPIPDISTGFFVSDDMIMSTALQSEVGNMSSTVEAQMTNPNAEGYNNYYDVQSTDDIVDDHQNVSYNMLPAEMVTDYSINYQGNPMLLQLSGDQYYEPPADTRTSFTVNYQLSPYANLSSLSPSSIPDKSLLALDDDEAMHAILLQ